MPKEHHPLFLGASTVPDHLKDAVVRHKGIDWYGYIAHVERRRNYDLIDPEAEPTETLLWVVYPPEPGGKGKQKEWTAGGSTPDELAVRRKK
jgi:hypothetical protein